MPRPTPFVHGDVLDATGRFTSTCIIERREDGTDDLGEPVDVWTEVDTSVCHPPVVNAYGAADGPRGGEVRRMDDTIVGARVTVLCVGIPDVVEGDRVRVDGAPPRHVTHVESDHQGITTRVLCEVVG